MFHFNLIQELIDSHSLIHATEFSNSSYTVQEIDQIRFRVSPVLSRNKGTLEMVDRDVSKHFQSLRTSAEDEMKAILSKSNSSIIYYSLIV